VTPLPPPPPAVPPRRILTKPWRGDGFLTMKLTVVGGLAGSGDLRGNLTSLGGAVEGGWRINNYLALGGGLSRNLHVRTRRVFYDSFTGDGFVYADTAGLTHFDFAFLRGYAPVKGRAQPWLDVGAGLALRDIVDVRDARAAASVRTTLGFDGWVARNTSIQVALQYRLIAAPGSVAHTLGGSIGLAFHW
jgi:hypothetical protein